MYELSKDEQILLNMGLFQDHRMGSGQPGRYQSVWKLCCFIPKKSINKSHHDDEKNEAD